MPYISRTPTSTTPSSSRCLGAWCNALQTYDGYLGIEAARNSDGTGVAAVYWKGVASIEAWAHGHQVGKRKGRDICYSHYMIRICKVERAFGRPDR